MHVEDVEGLFFLSKKGVPGQSYNIGSSNLIKISKIIDILRKI